MADALDWIREGLSKPGKTKSGLAAALNRSPSAITALLQGGRELKAREIDVVAEYLGVDPPHSSTVAPEMPGVLGTTAGKRQDLPSPDLKLPPPGQETIVRRPEIGNRDVPVMGTAVGGDGADFRLNGETIDRIARPPGIAHKKDVFALYVDAESMYPAFRPGDPLYLDPHRQPRAGDDVVVEIYGSDGEPGDAFVKRLVRRSPSKIVVEQFNPPKEIEFDAADVRQVLRVIPWPELVSGQ